MLQSILRLLLELRVAVASLIDNFQLLMIRHWQLEKRLDRLEAEIRALLEQRPRN
jgi:hypothetical protein